MSDPLLNAVRRGDARQVKGLIDGRASVELVTNNTTPLLFATEHGYKPIVQLLVNARARLHDKNAYGDTPLLIALRAGYHDIVKMLVHANGGISVPDRDGKTALMLAVEKEERAIVRMLVSADANVNSQDKKGMTALALAASAGQTKIVEELVRAREISLEKPNEQGRTPLMQALASVQGYCGKHENTLINTILDARARIDVQDADGITPLMMACDLRDASVVERLLQRDNIDVQDHTGSTALVRAVERRNFIGMRALLAAKADPDVRRKDGVTALLLCLSREDWSAAKELIAAGANVNIPPCSAHDDAEAPLLMLMRKRNDELVEHLLTARARVDTEDSLGRTALMWAARHEDARMSRRIAEAFITQMIEEQAHVFARMWTDVCLGASSGNGNGSSSTSNISNANNNNTGNGNGGTGKRAC